MVAGWNVYAGFFFNRSDGVEFQLLMAGHVIGRLIPGKGEWFIRRPFRLFVDEASLPQPDACIRQGGLH